MKTQADYEKLTQDIKAARAAGAAAESRHKRDFGDRGAFNFDSPVLVLHAEDGWSARKAERAARAADPYCGLLEPDGRGPRRLIEIHLTTKSTSSCDARTANAEAAAEALSAAGYGSRVFYELD